MFNLPAQVFAYTHPNLTSLEALLSGEDQRRLKAYQLKQDFWKGNQWDNIPAEDSSPRVTVNFCRMFADKLISKEFAGGVNFKFDESNEKDVLPFLKDIWEDNDGEVVLSEMAQAKGVLGDAYLLVEWEDKFLPNGSLNPDFDDPFDLYDKGRIRIYSIPPSLCYPVFKDGYDSRTMESCVVLIPQKVTSINNPDRYKILRRVYYKNVVIDYDGKNEIGRAVNPYGIVPVVHFPNLLTNGDFFGKSDLEDLMDINAEINFKNSDTSEIIDYHASPITCVYGMKADQLVLGPNKVWGGIPKDGKVERIEAKNGAGMSDNYVNFLKEAMHEIACVPKLATGAGEIPANISGIALQIHFGPMLDVIEEKRKLTKASLKLVNKIILKMAVLRGLLSAPTSLDARKKLYNHEIIWGVVLPKDLKTALEEIQQEMKMGLTTRKEALKQLKKDDIEQLLEDIDKEVNESPYYHGIEGVILSQGQLLVNQLNGEKIAEGKEVPQPSDSSPKTAQPDSKKVGENKDGGDIQTPSGMSNKNQGNASM